MRRSIFMAVLLLSSAAFSQESSDGPDDERPPSQALPPGQTPPPMPPIPQDALPPLPPPAPLPPLPPLPPFQHIAPTPPPTLDEIAHLEKSGHAMKAGGAVLIAFGAALEIAGDVMTLHSQFAATTTCNLRNVCSTNYNKSELIAGVVSSLAAGGLLYGGVAVLSAGGARVRRAQSLRYRLSPQFSSQQVSANFGLTF